MSYSQEDKQKIYDACVNKWGAKSQATLAMEEAAEFIKAMSKHMRANSIDTHDNLAEEVCDLRLMLNQIEYAYGLHTKCKHAEEWKLNRLEKKLQD